MAHQYTDEEDELIRTVKWGGQISLARRIGISQVTLSDRKRLLAKRDAEKAPKLKPRGARGPSIARPSFFEEDVDTILRKGKN